MKASRRLILFPGLGADARLFHRQSSLDAHIEIPPWIEPADDESLASYARRIALTIRSQPPYHIGGCSFGEMIALEVVRLLKPTAVILIASCKTPLAINQALLGLAPMARLMPKWLLQFSAHSVPSPFRNVLTEVPKMLTWGPIAIARWQGAEDCNAPIFHIHGSADRIIPARSVSPDRLIRNGGHLINITHAEEVNHFISEAFSRYVGYNPCP